MRVNKIVFVSILSCLILSSFVGCNSYDDYVDENYTGQGVINSEVSKDINSNNSSNTSTLNIIKQLSTSENIDNDIISLKTINNDELMIINTANKNVTISQSEDSNIIALINRKNSKTAKIVLKTDNSGNVLMLTDDNKVVAVKRALFSNTYDLDLSSTIDNTVVYNDDTLNVIDGSISRIEIVDNETNITGNFIIDTTKTVITVDSKNYVEDIPLNIDSNKNSLEDIINNIIDSTRDVTSDIVNNSSANSLYSIIRNIAESNADSTNNTEYNIVENEDGSKTVEITVVTDVVKIDDDNNIIIDTIETIITIVIPKNDTDSDNKNTDISESITNNTTTIDSTTSESDKDESNSTDIQKNDSTSSDVMSNNSENSANTKNEVNSKSIYEDLDDQTVPEKEEYSPGDPIEWEQTDLFYQEHKILPPNDPYVMED